MSAAQGGTIRAQAKKKQSAPQNKTAGSGDGQGRMDKEVVKAVLASPLIAPWPSIPRHLQTSVMAALPKLIPEAIAEYHVSRARCQQKDKRHRRQEKRQASIKEVAEGGKPSTSDGADAQGDVEAGDVSMGEGSSKTAKSPTSRPNPPAILEHLVLGINENIKALERAIDDIKFRLMTIGDALDGTHTPKGDLLPTAPRSPSPEVPDTPPPAFIVVPLQSVSPQKLVDPIPQYCATYNNFVYQWLQLKKVAQTRLKKEDWCVLGEDREEIRVVPLGAVEVEMAAMVGLRRLACLGLRTSHPDLQILHALLPKSILHPPRIRITLPFPSSVLKIHDAAGETPANVPKKRKAIEDTALDAPLTHIHYAPLAIKGIVTKTPVDGNAKKRQRLEEVKKKRIENKEKKKEDRRKWIAKGLTGEYRAKGRKVKQLLGDGRRSKKAANPAKTAGDKAAPAAPA